MEQEHHKRFLEAYEAYADALFRYCFFRVYSEARAEELMQETFMKTWEYISIGKEVENIRAFLYQVARNLIVDDARKRKAISLDVLLEESNAFEPVGDEGHEGEIRVLAEEVRSKLAVLKKEDRDILTMRFLDELSPQEIAEVLHISPNHASVKITRALKRLKKLFPSDE